MVLCETAHKILWLALCLPFTAGLSSLLGPACFGVSSSCGHFDLVTFLIACSLGGNCMQCSRPGMIYIAWWCSSDFLHSWCCFSPAEHGSNQSMPSNASIRLHGHDCAVQLCCISTNAFGVKQRTLLPPATFCPTLGFVSLCVLDYPITWNE